jgi:hypothetical protein
MEEFDVRNFRRLFFNRDCLLSLIQNHENDYILSELCPTIYSEFWDEFESIVNPISEDIISNSDSIDQRTLDSVLRVGDLLTLMVQDANNNSRLPHENHNYEIYNVLERYRDSIAKCYEFCESTITNNAGFN